MGKKAVSLLLISAVVICFGAGGPTAWSDESKAGTYGNGQPPAAQQPGEVAPVSVAEAPQAGGPTFETEGIGISPQIGMLNYRDTLGNVGNRMTYGTTADFNIARLANLTPDAFIGPQIGFIYSHLGAGNASFFGSTPSGPGDIQSGDPGTNAFFFPTDLKIGANMGNFRPSIHGGANLYYTSDQASFALGANPSTSTGAGWKYLPNLGVDLEYAVAKTVAIVLRPDLTFAGSNPVWSAGLGATIPLG